MKTWPAWVDLYGCRNPHCVHRLRTVEAGSHAPVHCGIKASFISTLTSRHWLQIRAKNKETINTIRGRINAAKHRRAD